MSADTLGWLALACGSIFFGYVLGYIAGRDGAERAAQATIADLRIQLRHLRRDIDHADESRPE